MRSACGGRETHAERLFGGPLSPLPGLLAGRVGVPTARAVGCDLTPCPGLCAEAIDSVMDSGEPGWYLTLAGGAAANYNVRVSR